MLFLFSGEELQLGHQNTGKGQNTADHLKGSHLHRIFPHKQTGHIAQPLRKQGNDRLHTHEDCGDGGWGGFLPGNLQNISRRRDGFDSLFIKLVGGHGGKNNPVL